MYIRKNELIRRLVAATGQNRKVFENKTVGELSAMYERCAANNAHVYLNVSYKDKDIVKLLGAKYDGEKKKWYIPPGVDKNLFSKWL